MHDEPRVRGLHGARDAQEQFQARIQVERAFAAVAVERQAVDVLHHQVRQARRRGAAVVQAGDVRMRQLGQDLALAGEPLGLRAAAVFQQLDRHAPPIARVVALGHEHRAHAAAGQALDQPPRAEAVAHLQLGIGEVGHRRAERVQRATERGGLRGEQLAHLALERRVVAQGVQARRLRRLGQVADRVEQLAQASPVAGVRVHAASARLSQALAKRRSRSTVGTDRPSAAATSVRSMPPK